MFETVEIAQLEVGHVVGVTAEGRPLVASAAAGNVSKQESAWLAVELTRTEMHRLIEQHQRVVLSRPAGLGGACVIVGVLRDRVVEQPQPPSELILEARERLVVRCGGARIVLHGDGRCEVLADRISQRARGVHAIKGAAVRIN